jgi:hypothetical protein
MFVGEKLMFVGEKLMIVGEMLLIDVGYLKQKKGPKKGPKKEEKKEEKEESEHQRGTLDKLVPPVVNNVTNSWI